MSGGWRRDGGTEGCSPGGCASAPDAATLREPAAVRAKQEPGRLDFFQGRNPNPGAVVVTSDGRRRNVPHPHQEPHGGISVDQIHTLLAGLDGLLELLLITGSRRENGGTRRDGRR